MHIAKIYHDFLSRVVYNKPGRRNKTLRSLFFIDTIYKFSKHAKKIITEFF